MADLNGEVYTTTYRDGIPESFADWPSFFLMRGTDAVTSDRDTWEVENVPDTTGALYTGSLTTPLRFIHVVSRRVGQWGIRSYIDKSDTLLVPKSRMINTTAPLAGGGDLSQDRTRTIAAASGSVPGYMSAAHYTLVNNATSAATANTLGKRGNNGEISFGAITGTTLTCNEIDGSSGGIYVSLPANGFWQQVADSAAQTTVPHDSQYYGQDAYATDARDGAGFEFITGAAGDTGHVAGHFKLDLRWWIPTGDAEYRSGEVAFYGDSNKVGQIVGKTAAEGADKYLDIRGTDALYLAYGAFTSTPLASVEIDATGVYVDGPTDFGANEVMSTFVPSSDSDLVNKLYCDGFATGYAGFELDHTEVAAQSGTTHTFLKTTGSVPSGARPTASIMWVESEDWAVTGASVLEVSVGIVNDPYAFLTGWDLLAAGPNVQFTTTELATTTDGLLHSLSAQRVTVTVTSVGANLSACTAGHLYVRVSWIMPKTLS